MHILNLALKGINDNPSKNTYMIEREGEKERAARYESNSTELSPGDAQFAGGRWDAGGAAADDEFSLTESGVSERASEITRASEMCTDVCVYVCVCLTM